MSQLLIEAAMVNPRGKAERLNAKVDFEALNEEWVQIRNVSRQEVSLNGLQLHHWQYSAGSGGKPKQALIIKLNGKLPPLTALRIHSGKGRSFFEMKLNVFHTYINSESRMYKYQIMKPERIILSYGSRNIDYVDFAPPVPVGKRLKRSANEADHKLIYVAQKAKK